MRISDTLLLRVSLVVSVVGVIGLSIIYSVAQPSLRSLDEIQQLENYEEVRVEGTIIAVRTTSERTLITLESSCNLIVVSEKPVVLQEGWRVMVTGTVDEYKGERQIKLNSITTMQ